MNRVATAALAATAALSLVACNVRDEGNQTAAGTTTTTATTDTDTTRVVRTEVPAPTPAPTQVAAPAIQTQPGPDGATVTLNRVQVTGDVMTVALSYSGGGCCSSPLVDDVSVIDDATSQRLGVLKDNAGKPMAAPTNTNGKFLSVTSSKNAPIQVWFKFPAPPATTKTVSITIPEVAPFDAVPVTR